MNKILVMGVMGAALLSGASGVAQERQRLSGTPLPDSAVLPQWPKPAPLALAADALVVRSQNLELVQAPGVFGGFVLRVSGKPMAVGQMRPLAGYIANGELKWLDLAAAAHHQCSVRKELKNVRVRFECFDDDGARWQLSQSFSPGSRPGTIEADIEITVDQDRDVAFLPMLMIFPGAGTFGAHKGQGLFAGLEYLEDEPSSSEADVIGPAAKREVPDNLKVTFPLMAVQNEDRYVALTWQMRPQFSAVFDSPDRLFGSGGHVMGVLFPGSDGRDREEGQLLPRVAQKLFARNPLAFRAVLMGGLGKTVVPAIQQYVALRGLPPLPAANLQLADYVAQAAAGWLDSGIRQSNLFHHAIAGGSFPAGRAADAAFWMQWLAERSPERATAARLEEISQAALAAVPPADLNSAGVGHVRYPVASLLYGHVAENAQRAADAGHQVLARFEPDGSIRYRPSPGGIDYSRTHYTNEANGLTARAVLDLLGAAAFSGRAELLEAGLKELRAMEQFRDGVPRGAQTWECPLHTPDILAAAHLVRAYTLGYELTGDPELLEEARYWAWTGVPFIYLVSPTDRPVGLYATIAVFGATQWKAPVWLGLPVQWCGLVYADALYRLARQDAKGPWQRLAQGITLSGIQQSWPAATPRPGMTPQQQAKNADLQGLLPDSLVLRAQHRNGPAINPATLEACAAQYFDRTPIYDFQAFRKSKLLVHAPGAIRLLVDNPGRMSFQVEPALEHPYYALVNGLKRSPRLWINGQATPCTAPNEFKPKEGWLILQLQGKAKVELGL